jgi:signal transduction histidine kinase
VHDINRHRMLGSTPVSGFKSRGRPACSAPGQGSKSQSGGVRLSGPPPPGRSSARGTVEAPQLLREACHDMHQPVAGVLRLAAAALAQPDVPAATRSCLEQIVTQTVSLTELIHQWLYPDEPDQAAVLLTQLAAEVSAAERVTYSGRIEFLSSAESVFIRVTRVDAGRIIANLLSNATRAAGPEGTVTVEVASDASAAKVAITDSGPGFGKIAKGKGMGLGIVAQGLARCGGRLEYGSDQDGGVRASLWLPLAVD